jgi:hypothetical protein
MSAKSCALYLAVAAMIIASYFLLSYIPMPD